MVDHTYALVGIHVKFTPNISWYRGYIVILTLGIILYFIITWIYWNYLVLHYWIYPVLILKFLICSGHIVEV